MPVTGLSCDDGEQEKRGCPGLSTRLPEDQVTGVRRNRMRRKRGMGLTGVLLVVFVVLKLTGLIAWSWWWVLSPIWISLAVTVAVLLCLALLAVARDSGYRQS